MFSDFYRRILNTKLECWLNQVPALLNQVQKEAQHGDFAKWQKSISHLPKAELSSIELKKQVRLGQASDLNQGQQQRLIALLKNFMPWRKGPFELVGVALNTEWRSDWKWDRVLPHLSPLKGRKVLDVGCGSGYHMFRMLGEEAELVIGADPTQLFLCQFQVIQHYLKNPDCHLLPLGIEQLPKSEAFDTVFSMGVLYHRRSPFEFLQQLKDQLRKGGELVLETIVVDGDENTVLVPGERYAKMRNVWFIPSTAALTHWLTRVGFSDIRTVDVCTTTIEEQRKTEWMENESLVDFLDPNDRLLTIEGYPAPKRAVLIAKK